MRPPAPAQRDHGFRGVFVSGTDTGVGKTVVAAAIVAALRARGTAVRALKPVITGLDEPAGGWPPDHELLAAVAGVTADEVVLRGYGPAVSPHLAAALASDPIDGDQLVRATLAAGEGSQVLVVEGVGGLLVPLADGWDVRRFVAAIGLPLVVVARPGLGTINHTLLTLEAARSSGLVVAAVVLTPWPLQPSVIERSNRDTIANLGEVDVWGFPSIERPEPELLAAAAATLPIDAWLLL